MYMELKENGNYEEKTNFMFFILVGHADALYMRMSTLVFLICA